jgi:uncharacterized protein YidB (DUF937 family)
MGILGQILTSVLTHSQTQSSNPTQASNPMQQGAHSMLESLWALIHGGLAGLIALLQQKGLGNLASGWVANGPNPPISPSQVTQVLGEQHVQQYAQQNGLSQSDAANALSQLLPHVVDHMTPDGSVPQQAANMDSMLASLKTKLA